MNRIITPAATLDDPRWHAVVTRDPGADGRFYYSVDSTGVYCRPSCSARRPRPENVRFHATREEAEQAGFRPCKRCRPDRLSSHAELDVARIAVACRLIEEADAPPALAVLAQHADLSVSHFRRLFRSIVGLTPRQYAVAQRERRMRDALGCGAGVTAAIYHAGYNASSRFYEKSDGILGMTPTRYRAGGMHEHIRFAIGQCALGAILVARSERGVCAIALGDDPDRLARDLQDRFPCAELIGGDSDFEQLVAHVVGFVEAPGVGLDLPLDVRGTAFQQRVWRALRGVPPGETLSYTDLARRIGVPSAVRAVASACAANVLAVAIPCHRVVRSDGSLSGYRWGVERKRALLEREARMQPPRRDDDAA